MSKVLNAVQCECCGRRMHPREIFSHVRQGETKLLRSASKASELPPGLSKALKQAVSAKSSDGLRRRLLHQLKVGVPISKIEI